MQGHTIIYLQQKPFLVKAGRQAGALPEVKQKPEAGPLSRSNSLIPGALLSYLEIDDSRS